jgi:drug/metabolite transporter (DMT)-like permease
MPNKPLLSFMLLLLLGFIWGTGYSIARYATLNGVPPLGYSFWQSLGPAILISLISCFGASRFKFSLPHLRYYLICGLTGIAIPNTNMYFAAPHLPAGLLAVIVNTVPVVAYPMALIAGLESFQMMRFMGVVSAICGIMLIIIPSASLPSPHMVPWVLSALITPVSFAFCAVYISRYRPEKGDSLSLAAGTLIASSLLLLPIVILDRSFYALHLPLTPADWVILLEILLSSIGYVVLFQLIKMAGPVYYSLVDAIVALKGLFWGYLIFHEKLNIWTATAVGLILIALFFITNPKTYDRIHSK